MNYNNAMNNNFTRRDFLKWSTLGLTSIAFRSMRLPGELVDTGDIARIGTDSVSVYSQPDDKSRILYQRYRDELVNLYYEVQSEKGPIHNPLWYRVWRGYIHSAHLQKVNYKLNPVTSWIPEKGQIAEVTVPYTQTMRYTSFYGWEPVYRLYYGSNHWVVDVEEGPDGKPWYKLIDELIDIDYHVPAEHLHMVGPEEFEPIHPDVPYEMKRIEVSLAQQTLTAFEGNTVVMKTKISSGLNFKPIGHLPWNTPTGTYNIYSKMPSKHMGDGNLTSDINAYEIPGVPWVCFFVSEGGVATHGTYWHNNFGTPMSHGCVNMRNEEAKWLFRWTYPIAKADDWEKVGFGTPITVK